MAWNAGGRDSSATAPWAVSAIDAEGVVREPTVEATQALRQAMQERLQVVPTEMGPMNLRKISLRQLEAALQQAVDAIWGTCPMS